MRLQPHAAVYAALAAAGMLVGIAASEPAATAFGAAFLLPLVYSAATASSALPNAHSDLSQTRLLEGDSVDLSLTLTASEQIDWLEIDLPMPPRVRLVDGSERLIVALSAGEARTFTYRVCCSRWGAYRLGPATLTAVSHPFAVSSMPGEPPPSPVARVYPRLEALRRLVVPLATRPASGNRASGATGEGIEFAEIREFHAGERVRRINWRASARRGQLLVSDRHPERSSDVIVFLDSLAQAGDDDATTLDFAVRAVGTLVAAYLRRRDRVGLLSFGSDLTWVLPSGGARQQYRIVDAVLGSESSTFYRWRDPRLIPQRILPAQSLLVALTPLLDWRVIRALLDLRGRGYDVAVIEVDPVRFVRRESGNVSEDARRLWLLEREFVRSRFRQAGCPVTRWDGEAALAGAVEELAWAR